LAIVKANLRLLKELDEDYTARHGGYKFGIKPPRSAGRNKESVLDYFARTCWGCGWELEDSYLTRCHVVMDWAGGSMAPSNFLLLCDYCHAEQPEEANRDIQVEWLKERERKWTRIYRESEALLDALRKVPDSTEDLLSLFWLRMHRFTEDRSCRFGRFLSSTHSYKPSKAQRVRLALLPRVYAKFLRAVARYEVAISDTSGTHEELLRRFMPSDPIEYMLRKYKQVAGTTASSNPPAAGEGGEVAE
jgi:hypothetical protein